MSDINSFICTGRLTRDVQAKFTQNGLAIANFGVAVGRRYKDKDETTFVECVAFGKLSEVMNEYLQKGSRVALSGRFTTEQWTDKEGQKRSALKFVVEQMTMLDGRKDGQQQPGRQRQNTYDGGDTGAYYGDSSGGFDDDVPF